jgi:hypothetical protein
VARALAGKEAWFPFLGKNFEEFRALLHRKNTSGKAEEPVGWQA